MAEKTDLGRLASPSFLRLVDEAMNISGKSSQLNGIVSAEIWDSLERILEVTMDFNLSITKFICRLYRTTNDCKFCRGDLLPFQNLFNLAAFL